MRAGVVLSKVLMTSIAVSTAHAYSLEVAISPSIAMGLGGSGLSLGAGINVLMSTPKSIASYREFSSGIGFLVNADIFFKTFINTKIHTNSINEENDRFRDTIFDNTQNQNIAKKHEAQKFLMQYRNNVQGVPLYRIVQPKNSVGLALVLHNKIFLGSVKMNVFIGPRLGYMLFTSQDALGYLYDHNSKVEAIEMPEVAKNGADAIMHFDRKMQKLPINLPSAKLSVSFSKPTPKLTKLSGIKASGIIQFLYDKERKMTIGKDAQLSIDVKSTTVRKGQKARIRYITGKFFYSNFLKFMSSKSSKGSSKTIRTKFEDKDRKRFEFFGNEEAGNKVYYISTMTLGANFGIALETRIMRGMTLGLEASYQLDAPIHSFNRIDFTSTLVKLIETNIIQNNLSKKFGKVSIGDIKLVYKKMAFVLRDSSNVNQFKVYHSGDVVPSHSGDTVTRTQVAKLPYGPISAIPTSKMRVIRTGGTPRSNVLHYEAIEYIKAVNKHTTRENQANKLDLKASKITFAMQKGHQFLSSDSPYSTEAAERIADKIASVRNQYSMPIMHKFNLGIRIGILI